MIHRLRYHTLRGIKPTHVQVFQGKTNLGTLMATQRGWVVLNRPELGTFRDKHAAGRKLAARKRAVCYG